MEDNARQEAGSLEERTDSLVLDAKKPKRNRFSITEKSWRPQYTLILAEEQRGLDSFAIGKKLGLTPTHVRRIQACDYYRQKRSQAALQLTNKIANKMAIRKTSDKVMDKLEAAAIKAASTLIKALKHPKDVNSMQVNVAKDILDRTGFKAKDKIELETHERAYSVEEVESAKATLQELECAVTRLSIKGSRFVLNRVVRNAPAGSATEESPPQEDLPTTDPPEDADFSAEDPGIEEEPAPTDEGISLSS